MPSELDAEVAERIMGWYRDAKRRGPLSDWHELDCGGKGRCAPRCGMSLPRYSEDLSTTMEMMGWLAPSLEDYNLGRKSCRFIVHQQDNGAWYVEARSPFLTSYDTPAFADGPSLPEALCRAALQAIAAEVNTR